MLVMIAYFMNDDEKMERVFPFLVSFITDNNLAVSAVLKESTVRYISLMVCGGLSGFAFLQNSC